MQIPEGLSQQNWRWAQAVCLSLWLGLISVLPAAEPDPVAPPPPPPPAPTETPGPAEPPPASQPPPAVDWSRFTYLQTLGSNTDGTTARLSADGRRVIAIEPNVARVWQVADGTLLGSFQPTNFIAEAVALNRDGTQAYLWDSNGNGESVDVATGQSTPMTLPVCHAQASQLLDDDRMLLVIQGDGKAKPILTLQVWQIADARVQGTLEWVGEWNVSPDRIIAHVMKKDRTWSIMAMDVKSGSIRELAVNSMPRMHQNSNNYPVSLQSSSDGSVGLMVDSSGAIHRWNWQEGREFGSPIASHGLRGITMDAAGTRVALIENSGDLRIIDFKKGTELARISQRIASSQFQSGDVTLDFTPDGSSVLAGPLIEPCFYYCFQMWCTVDGTEQRKVGGPLGYYYDWGASRILLTAGRVLVADQTTLEIWGSDPEPPQTNRDPLMTAELGRQGLRHTLFDVVINGSAEDVAARIRDHPNELKRRDFRSAFPLICAIETGRIEVVRALLDAGADPSHGDVQGYLSPVLAAACTQNREIMELLWSRGGRLDGGRYYMLNAVSAPNRQRGDRGWITSVLVQEAPPPCTRQELAAWFFDHQRVYEPRVIRRVVDDLRYDLHDEATARYVYHRAAFVETYWLLLLQAVLIALGIWRYRVVRRRQMSAAAASATPPPAAAHPVATGANIPVANPAPVPGAGWGDDGSGGAAGLTPEQAQQLADLRLRNQRARIAPLITLLGSLVVAILPAVNWYWLGHDINDFIWLPFGALVVWAFSYIRWTWLRLLNHLTGIVGGVAGFIGGFMAWYSSAWQGPQDVGVYILCLVAGFSALPMAFGMARNLPVVWQLGKLERIEKAARKAARQALRKTPEEDLGVKPGWDTQNTPQDPNAKNPTENAHR